MNLSNQMFDVIKGNLEVLEQGLQEAVTSTNDLVKIGRAHV